MKYLSKITLGLILCTGFMTSCKDDDEAETPNAITIDKETITISAEGGTEIVAVSSNANWVAGASEPWITVSPANGLGSTECSLAVDSTLLNVSRTAQVRFSQEGQEPKLVTITQFGYSKQIVFKEPTIEIENSAKYDKRYFEVTISTNVAFEIKKDVDYSFAEEETMTENEKESVKNELKDWIIMPKDDDLKVDLDRGARPRTIKVRFRWDMNIVPYTRVAKIHLVPTDPEKDQLVDENGNNIDKVTLVVNQKPAIKIEDNRAGDSLSIITINSKIQAMTSFDTSENMMNWSGIKLWEATDKDKGLPSQEAIGRVRSITFMMPNLKDGEAFPKEIGNLKYLESFTVQSNENSQIRDVALCEELCDLKYLKKLTVFAYGLTKFPTNFTNLGKSLESLDIASNNFASLSTIIAVVNETNFPKLTSLSITGCRRNDSLNDLSQASNGIYNGKPIGLWSNITMGSEKDAFLKLLTWDNLRVLSLSYNFIEGMLPNDNTVKTALKNAGKPETYQEADFYEGHSEDPEQYLNKLSKDTCSWLLSNNTVKIGYSNIRGNTIPRVLPKVRKLAINLNFLNNSLPNWIRLHPYFVEWQPETFIFTQQEKGKNTSGADVGFTGIDAQYYDYSYYYGKTGNETSNVAYPLYYKKYVINADN